VKNTNIPAGSRNLAFTQSPKAEENLLEAVAVKADHRDNNFDFLRLALSVLVLYCHSYQLFYGYNCDPLQQVTDGQISFGAFAVNGFFSISGFLVAQSWLRSRGLLDYTKRRVLRIYPGFIVVLLLGMLVVGPLSGVNVHAYFHNSATYKYMTNVFLTYCKLPGVFPTNPYPWESNGSLWTIRYEILCYIGVALFGMAQLLKRNAIAVLWVVVFAFYIFVHIHPLSFSYTGGSTHVARLLNFFMPGIGSPEQLLRLTISFLSGTLFGLWNERNRYSNIGIVISLLAMVVACHFQLIWYVLGLCQTYLLFAIAFHPKIRLQFVGKKGDYSYGVYLYAFPIQQLLMHYFGHDLNQTCYFLSALVFTMIAAYLSWHLVERPALSLIPSRRRPITGTS